MIAWLSAFVFTQCVEMPLYARAFGRERRWQEEPPGEAAALALRHRGRRGLVLDLDAVEAIGPQVARLDLDARNVGVDEAAVVNRRRRSEMLPN